MARKLVCLLLSVGLVAMFAACSDDDEKPKDAFVYPDSGPQPDGPLTDQGPPSETAPPDAGDAATPDADQGPPPAQYSGMVALVEYVGKKSAAGPTIRLGGYLASMERTSPADPLATPDFIDSPTPPNCYAYKWSATSPKKGNAWDAGKITITGHKTGATVVYIDADDVDPTDSCSPACTAPQYCKLDGTCGTPSAVPANIELTLQAAVPPRNPSSKGYYWNLPTNTLLLGDSWFDTGTTIDISAAGGADVPAFSKTGLAVASAPTLKASTDLTALDPAAIKIEWDTPVTGAALVGISMRTWLADKSEGTDITCSQVAVVGSKDIPAAALALLPTPGTTADKALIMQTAVLGLAVTGGAETWGEWKVGAGKGVFGVTCRLGSSVIPCP